MILVFGKTGQVARELSAISHDSVYLGRAEADLSDPDACAAVIRDHAPTAVINAAAYTAVDKAEKEEVLASTINGAAPGAMATACAALGIPLVHISTDYVFDGSGTAPWSLKAATGPLGVYGQSKLAGEEAVRRAGGVHGILRTSWVFSAHGSNFLKTMLRLSETRDHLTVVADQIGGPTPAEAIARTCLNMAETLISEPNKGGTYHYSGAPDASWADFAREIFTAAGRNVTVEDIPSSAYPTPAARPLNSRLDCAALAAQFGITRPDWKQATHEIVGQLI